MLVAVIRWLVEASTGVLAALFIVVGSFNGDVTVHVIVFFYPVLLFYIIDIILSTSKSIISNLLLVY